MRTKDAAPQGELVSIIIPVYNAAAFLRETIQTVVNQTYSNWELILVNDHSSDNGKEIAASIQDPRIKWVDLKRNGGAAVARNKGIELASGRYICFLDADDIWKKDKLSKQISFMQKTDCAFAFTSYAFANQCGTPTGKEVHVPATITYRQALKNTTIWTSTVMFDMAKLSKSQIYMPNVKSEDTATWWNILRQIDCAYGYDDILSLYRRGGKTLSSNKLEAVKRAWNLYKNVEQFSLAKSSYYMCRWAINAVRRRM